MHNIAGMCDSYSEVTKTMLLLSRILRIHCKYYYVSEVYTDTDSYKEAIKS